MQDEVDTIKRCDKCGQQYMSWAEHTCGESVSVEDIRILQRMTYEYAGNAGTVARALLYLINQVKK